MKKLLAFLALVVLLLPATTLAAGTSDVARVALRLQGCDYYIVTTKVGYAVLEWYGGNDPRRGDIIVGNLHSFGFRNLYNTTAKRSMRVWLEDYWLSSDRAIEILYDKCN